MYTKLQQSRITYERNESLSTVLQKHKLGLRLIKFQRMPGYKYQAKAQNLADVILAWVRGERTIFVDTGNVQCSPNRLRSDLDLFLLCRHYFSMSYKEFQEHFEKLKNLKYKDKYGDHIVLGRGYCSFIQRRVYYNITRKEYKDLIRENFSNIKLKINKTPNIGETL